MKLRAMVFGPAYLDRVLRVDRPLVAPGRVAGLPLIRAWTDPSGSPAVAISNWSIPRAIRSRSPCRPTGPAQPAGSCWSRKSAPGLDTAGGLSAG